MEKHRHEVVLGVLGALAALAYLWTDWMTIWAPPPRVTEALKPWLGPEGYFHSGVATLTFPGLPEMNTQLQILLLLTAPAFLLSYYLPPPRKKLPVVMLTLLGVGLVCGSRALLALGAFHLSFYLVLHRPRPRSGPDLLWALALAGLWGDLFGFLGAALLWGLYARGGEGFLKGAGGRWLGSLLAWSPLWVMAAGAAGVALLGWEPFKFSLEFVILAWSWIRIIWYHADYRDGRVPTELSLTDYLATFFSPAYLAALPSGHMIGKGYSYHSRSFLARDKNTLALSGLAYLAWAFVFLSLGPWLVEGMAELIVQLKVPVFKTFDQVMALAKLNIVPRPLSLWGLFLIRVAATYFLLAGFSHLKVGLWRLMGYDLEPNFDWALLSTNFLEFWRRFNFYLREFYLTVFYYPVFLRLRGPRWWRTTVAIFAAAGAGNFLAHLVDDTIAQGVDPERLWANLRTLPYYLGFSLALTLNALWQLRQPRPLPKPWKGGWKGVAWSGLGLVLTLSTYIWLRFFHYTPMYHPFANVWKVARGALGL